MAKLSKPVDYNTVKMIEVGKPDHSVEYACFWPSEHIGLAVSMSSRHPGVSDRLYVKVHMGSFYPGTHQEWEQSTQSRIEHRLEQLGIIREGEDGYVSIDYKAYRAEIEPD